MSFLSRVATVSAFIRVCRPGLSNSQVQVLTPVLTLQRFDLIRCLHRTAVTRKEISQEPIKFSTSPANTQSKIKEADVNPFQNQIVVFSLAIFMLYFFILREENDLDEMLYLPNAQLEAVRPSTNSESK